MGKADAPKIEAAESGDGTGLRDAERAGPTAKGPLESRLGDATAQAKAGEPREPSPADQALSPTLPRSGPPLPPGSEADDPAQPEDEQDESLVGRVLSGLYRLEEKIGEGGMGTVYRATHVHLKKDFAVKVLARNVINNQQAMERFQQEAIAASQIDHDNIVDVVNFDIGEDAEVFIVMELLKGHSLAHLVELGRMPVERALPIAVQICSALTAAHERSIVHRDLKPENVFILRRRGREFVKVLDFGISKVRSAEAEQVRMTRTGQLVGTPLYMSPEQAKGESDVDLRADVYAMGIILYEMLTGTPPFTGCNYFQLLWKHGNEAAEPISQRCPEAEVPPVLEEIIHRALEKDPKNRFQTMAELETALLTEFPNLKEYIPPPPAPPPPAPPAPVSQESIAQPPATKATARSALAAVALCVVVGLGAAFLLLPSADPTSASGPGPEHTATSEHATTSSEAATSPQEPLHRATERSNPETLVAEAPGLEEASSTVDVRFTSSPAGATVHDGEVLLGTTPFTTSLQAGAALRPEFRLRGHRPRTTAVTPEQGSTVHVRLLRLPRQPSSTSLRIKKVF